MGMLPIRKVKFNRVALTSYYGKAFVTRGQKAQHDYGRWLQNQVMQKGLTKTDPVIQSINPADVSDQKLNAARNYTALSRAFKTIKARDYVILFSQKDVQNEIPEPVLKKFAVDGNLVIGYSENGYLILDKFGSVYTTLSSVKLDPFGTLEQFLGIDTIGAPVDYASVGVYAKDIPVGVILSYYLGFTELMRLLKVEPRRVQAGQRVNLQSDEYSLTFADETLVFSREDQMASMILGGFAEYHKTCKLFSVYSFDTKGVYLNLLESAGFGVRFLREIDLLNQMFVDPITRQILEQMKEPQTFQGLLVRSCELLMSDEHPDELDPVYMRDKGYERISGAIYAEMVQSIRNHNSLMGKSNKKIDHNPYAVWKRIVEDPSKMQVNEINPIMELKEGEAVTFAGVGGRSKRSMVKDTRVYHENDLGTISESTVDSSDVAINVFTSANPNYDSLLGTTTRYNPEKDGAAALLSTSALLAANSNRDD